MHSPCPAHLTFWQSTIPQPSLSPYTTMSSEVIDITHEVFLPNYIKQSWIPLDGLSVPHLFQFTRYPPGDVPYYDYPNLSQFVHEEGVFNFSPNTLLQLGPPPSRLSDRYTAAIKVATFPIHSFTLVPLSGHPIRLPVWVLDYWREVKRPMGYRHDWKTVLVWLRGVSQSQSMVEICHQAMAGLSCFPWNGGNCSVRDMVLLLTNSGLSDYHINFTLEKISRIHNNHYGAKVSDHHTLFPLVDIASIIDGYAQSHDGGGADRRRELLEVENRITTGHMDSVAGILHLPNHWTSLVITFKPPRILYGDSLGSPMPSKMARSFRRWVCHMLRRSGHPMPESDISIYPLPTSTQHDVISCGLFALNAIGHYYLPENFPLLAPGSLSLAQSRLELALDLLQEGAVS